MIWVDKLKNKIKTWLDLQPASGITFRIDETLDYRGNAFKNKIWYRGDSHELEQLYKQIPYKTHTFWASVPSRNMEIRKIHTGIPSITVDILAGIVLSDLNDFVFENTQLKDLWDNITEDNKLTKVYERALKETLYIGDGAFKISFDPYVSNLPIVEFYSGEKIDIQYDRGRMKEVVFHTTYKKGHATYILDEIYGYGYVNYQLNNEYGQSVLLNTLQETADLEPVTFDKSLNMAMPLMFYESSRWEGRGQSIFDRKCDDYDALDEVWSQWMDAVRTGRARSYFPDSMIPRDKDNGALLRPNPFDNRFIRVKQPISESGQPPKVEVVQPDIPTSDYLNSYITALDLCLQGLISPSTLGIDVKKLDNAEAQREKEKATLYSRSDMVSVLEKFLPKLVDTVIMAYDIYNNRSHDAVKVDIDFGEYANPSFEAQVETVTKARTATIMSIEASVDELYGDSKDEKWKEEEVQRIKEELGIAEMQEPAVNNVSEGIENVSESGNKQSFVPDAKE